MTDRRQESYAIRLEAAELARGRTHPTHEANGDEERFAGAKYFMSFTKGLPHHPDTGLLNDPRDFVQFRRAIDEGFIDPFTSAVRHGAHWTVAPNGAETPSNPAPGNYRQWEAPTAGTAYELEGPDAQAVTMPPAPPLLGDDGKPNPELVFEMAEVYELAVLRDQPLNAFETGNSNPAIDGAVNRLNNLPYMQDPSGRPRKVEGGALTPQTVFRGSSPGVEVGPYLSQFMLIGNTDVLGGSVRDGLIRYGVLQIDQRVPVATEGRDYMQCMADYVAVQRGLRPDPETFAGPASGPATRRFITTPRDLATYVHYDALYEAYLNACLILLAMGTPTDPAFDQLSGVGAGSGNPDYRRHAGGFALYGGPHILTLVTEVATRALKAVRFQKFNNHIRLRPEALAARLELVRRNAAASEHVPQALLTHMTVFAQELQNNGTLAQIESLNAAPPCTGSGTPQDANSWFLPMAFPEGSPMHPAYGAGHATVAGACVTILKAYFDTSSVLVEHTDLNGNPSILFKPFEHGDTPVQFRAPALPAAIPDCAEPCVPPRQQLDMESLSPEEPETFLTLEGELNKLAANISIGRNMAGVHYFSDYYDSLRMGEEIAIGILEEQALTYPTDPFVLSVPTFDGEVRRIGRR
ncbi:hypothetical protein [Thiohalocapsa sp.]|uniref:hypothetical protein n=1 Tax=Thiohalocapsa sp. TaxID=2497641 RepID=UPI0025DC1D08|nr:hypothetical protein [Thiohalocapsa sp.]